MSNKINSVRPCSSYTASLIASCSDLGASTNSLDRKSSLTDRATSPTVENIDNDSKVDATHRQNQDKNLMNEAEITIEPVEQQVKSPSKKHARHSSMDLAHGNPSISQLLEKCVSNTDTQDSQLEDDSKCELAEETKDDLPQAEEEEVKDEIQKEVEEKLEEYVNHRGIRFTPQEETPNLQPYGLVCVRELFRFVISLCNPLEGQNTSAMVQLGLALVGTALEVAADQLPRYPALLHLVRDPLCRNLLSQQYQLQELSSTCEIPRPHRRQTSSGSNSKYSLMSVVLEDSF
ncbi:Golgi-specific brefeldin A-resistance guanine nucleotide exchange factor 1 [Papilio machaon]|uniref:Golgi-specific brefeldin A-resistance guanine nucleotide exchange factor 1 n=1 Tax=Papilio machaon TaxID=76193 RepID=A0A0N1IB66_PAPMA|nr:Golgi-specific brefeldin A-resistance guanine nucleotide exchange factor 1 [Papilio machaon]